MFWKTKKPPKELTEDGETGDAKHATSTFAAYRRWSRLRKGNVYTLSLGMWARIDRIEKDWGRPHWQDKNRKVASDKKTLDEIPKMSGENSIRLFVLDPGSGDEPLSGHLIETTVEDAPEYEVLSYLWPLFDEDDLRALVRLPIGDRKIYWDTANALFALRDKEKPRTLWVDFLCLNQGDEKETEDYLSLAGDLIKRAKRTIGWLGNPRLHSDTGMEVLEFLAVTDDMVTGNPWARYPAAQVNAGLADILMRIYFRYAWMFTDCARASTVRLQVGNRSTEWTTGEEARRFLSRVKLFEIWPYLQSPLVAPFDLKYLRDMLDSELGLRPARTDRLLDVVHRHRHRRAGDPRYRVYAYLSLIECQGIEEDLDISTEELYEKLCGLEEAEFNRDEVLEGDKSTLCDKECL